MSKRDPYALPPSKNKSDEKRTKPYGKRKTLAIQYVYAFAILGWILVIAALGLRPSLGWSLLVLFIPILVYGFGMWNTRALTVEVEDSVFSANYLSIGLLLILPLLVWITNSYCGDKALLLKIMVVAIVLSMLSLIDFWVSKKWLSVAKHVKSVLQTASLALLIYALCLFLASQCKTDAAVGSKLASDLN